MHLGDDQFDVRDVLHDSFSLSLMKSVMNTESEFKITVILFIHVRKLYMIYCCSGNTGVSIFPKTMTTFSYSGF